MSTPENYARAAARLEMLQQPIGVATSPTHRYPLDTGRTIQTIVDPGRTKPVPRTLQQAFPISEGYRNSIYAYRRGTRLDRISWAIVLGLAGLLVWWVIVTPKGHP